METIETATYDEWTIVMWSDRGAVESTTFSFSGASVSYHLVHVEETCLTHPTPPTWPQIQKGSLGNFNLKNWWVKQSVRHVMMLGSERGKRSHWVSWWFFQQVKCLNHDDDCSLSEPEPWFKVTDLLCLPQWTDVMDFSFGKGSCWSRQSRKLWTNHMWFFLHLVVWFLYDHELLMMLWFDVTDVVSGFW